MTKNDKLRELCKMHTCLSDEDIDKVIDVSQSLDSVSALMGGADVFIECITMDPPDIAIVVAESNPPTNTPPTLYEGSVVGEFAYRKNEPAVLRTLEIGMPTTDMWAITQEYKTVSQNVAPPILNKNGGEVIAALIAEKDVTKDVREKKNFSDLAKTAGTLMDELMSSGSGEQSIQHHLNEGIVMFDENGMCTYANPVAQNIYQKLGYLDKLKDVNFSNLVLDNTKFSTLMERKNIRNKDVKVRHFILDIKYAVMDCSDENMACVVMLINDLTDFKEKEKELILKSVAISEIHHRIKNNLQTIASLLRLHSRRINDEGGAKASFYESISRVLSIATTHDILAEEGGVDNVDIMTMLTRIKGCFSDHMLFANGVVKFSIVGDTFLIDSDKATSIALVVNEVIQNCLKYAFVGRGGRGSIIVEICKGGATYSNISIRDDGVGGYNVDNVATISLGSKIIQRIVEDKLKGKLTIQSSENGTIVLFDFPHGAESNDAKSDASIRRNKDNANLAKNAF